VKRSLFLLGLLAAAAAGAQTAVPQIAFDSVADAIKMPKDLYLGEASGVAVNSKGHVFGWRVQTLLLHPN